jgi:hypothetical protein
MYYDNENSANLAEKSTLIIHRPRSEHLDISSEIPALSIIETRCYGNSAVDFIRERVDTPPRALRRGKSSKSYR